MRIPAGTPVFVAVCVLLLGISSGNLRPHEPDADALLEINRQIMEDTILKQDPATLLKYAHPDYRVVAPGGRVETKEETAAGATSVVATGLEITQEQVMIVDNTGVVIGKVDIDGVMKPVGRLGPGKFMAVFVKQDGDWEILSRALTPCIKMAIEHGFC
jgi:hypothetical protein